MSESKKIIITTDMLDNTEPPRVTYAMLEASWPVYVEQVLEGRSMDRLRAILEAALSVLGK